MATYIGLFFALFGPARLALFSKMFLPDRPSLVESMLAESALGLICATVLVILVFWERRTLSSIGIKPLSLWSIAWGLAFAAFLIWVYSPVLGWLMALERIPWFTEGIAKLDACPLWYLTLMIIIGGTADELQHHGYVPCSHGPSNIKLVQKS